MNLGRLSLEVGQLARILHLLLVICVDLSPRLLDAGSQVLQLPQHAHAAVLLVVNFEGRLSHVFLFEPTFIYLGVVVASLSLFDSLLHALDLRLETQLVEVDAGDLELLLILDPLAEAR